LSARRSASRSEGVRIPKVEDVFGFVSREASWVDIEDLSDRIAEAFSDGINPASRRNQYARSACVDKSHCADDRATVALDIALRGARAGACGIELGQRARDCIVTGGLVSNHGHIRYVGTKSIMCRLDLIRLHERFDQAYCCCCISRLFRSVVRVPL
jgi:hypothetical protein